MSSPREAGAPEAEGPISRVGSPGTQKRATPPEAPRVRNPFERALIHRLHTPICSPGMCKVYKKSSDGTFRWEIEQRCTLMPVDIVACSSQFEPSPDPHLDRIHEEATERFFSQGAVVPSPFVEPSKKVKPLIHSSSSGQHSEEGGPKIVRDASAQTLLTLPPHLPLHIEAILESFCTYTQDQSMCSEYEADSWLRRKLEFEGHSDSEQTDDETATPPQPQPQPYESHAPLVFSPDLSRNVLSKGMKRTFGTPISKLPDKKTGYHNKIFDGLDLGEPCFSPIDSHAPATPVTARATSSLASQSISPVAKMMSSDDEKHNLTSPESEEMATCLNCVSSRKDLKRRVCYCKPSPGAGSSLLTRSASMKESPALHRRDSSGGSSVSGKRSASMSSLHRSRSVQRLDFSADMSVDGSLPSRSCEDLFRCNSVLGGSDSSGSPKGKSPWQLGTSGDYAKSDLNLYKTDFHADEHRTIDETPIKGKSKAAVLNHVISHIRSGRAVASCSPIDMSLDNSIDHDDQLDLEDKKIDFNSIDLKLLTAGSRYDLARNAAKMNEATSLKRLDSGFNENTTFFGSKSSYYESAIKPSELTVTDFTKTSHSKSALKEASNVNWMRVDSGFKDETSSDYVQFYSEGTSKDPAKFCFPEKQHLGALDGPDKENVSIEDFDKFLVRASTRGETMSISDIFADEMVMNCNFSSTPSKNKARSG